MQLFPKVEVSLIVQGHIGEFVCMKNMATAKSGFWKMSPTMLKKRVFSTEESMRKN